MTESTISERTYGLALDALSDAFQGKKIPDSFLYTREDGSKLIRPLTFRETLQARVGDYWTEYDQSGELRSEEDRLRLLKVSLDSCTGVAYKADSSKFKIIPLCQQLIELPMTFRAAFVNTPYYDLAGEELDWKKGIYNEELTLAEVLEHPAWLVAVEGDRALLKEYAGLIVHLLNEKNKKNKMMAFFVCNTSAKDELGELFVSDLYSTSNANGASYLNCRMSFLSVAPRAVGSHAPKDYLGLAMKIHLDSGRQLEEVLKDQLSKNMHQMEVISQLQRELARKGDELEGFKTIKDQLKTGKIIVGGKEYVLLTKEEKALLDTFTKNPEHIDKGAFRYIRTKKPQPKIKKLLEFD